MYTGKDQQPFTFWKRPWAKWLLLLAVFLQAISLTLLLQEYREYEGLYQRGILFSQTPDQWESYASRLRLRLALQGMLLLVCLDAFLMGLMVRSKQGLRLAEAISLLLLSAAWGAAGPALQLTAVPGHRTIWILFLLALAAVCGWSWIQYLRIRNRSNGPEL